MTTEAFAVLDEVTLGSGEGSTQVRLRRLGNGQITFEEITAGKLPVRSEGGDPFARKLFAALKTVTYV
jgi:hypothetical protein